MNNITAQVHLVPTDSDNPTKVALMLLPQKNQLYQHIAGGEFRKGLQMGHKPQHIYFTTDEEIKEGDWHINLLNNAIEKASRNVAANWKSNMSYNNGTRFLRDDYRKIVATTNKELCDCNICISQGTHIFSKHTSNIGLFDTQFIEQYISAYNAGTPIKEVLLEQVDNGCEVDMEGQGGSDVGWMPKLELKLKPDGSVIVVSKEERLYTRDEFKAGIAKVLNDNALSVAETGVFNAKKWFNKNYPE